MTDTNQAYIVSACRSGIGNFLGGLSHFNATQLGAMAIKEAVKRSGIASDKIEEVIMGPLLGRARAQDLRENANGPYAQPGRRLHRVSPAARAAEHAAARRAGRPAGRKSLWAPGGP